MGFRDAIRDIGHRSLDKIRAPPNPSHITGPNQANTSSSRLTTTKAAHEDSWEVLQSALRALEKGSAILPPLKSVVSDLADGVDMIKTATQGHQEYKELALELAPVVLDLNRFLGTSKTLNISDSLLSVIKEIEHETGNIDQRQKRKGFVDIEDLVRCYRRIEILFQRLQSNAILSVWSLADEQLATTRLESTHPANDAQYNSGKAAVVGRRQCAPNTRMAILQGLREWKDDPNSAKVYWINGMAGTGKTTIGYTLCAELASIHKLGASFFCSRELPDCRDATRIVPTIAYQLARFSFPFQVALCRVLAGDPDIRTRAVSTQFEKLLCEPLLEVKETIGGEAVVMVDALDECADRVNVQEFLDVLFRHIATLPIRFLITFRPEPGLHDRLSLQPLSAQTVLLLHDIEEAVVQSDIETYLAAELQGVPVDTIKQLAKLSGRFFVFAATVVRYVKPRAGAVRYQRLKTVVGATSNPEGGVYRSIDALYTTILSNALSDPELSQLEHKTMEQVLRMVICAREPLTVATLAALLDIVEDDIELSLESLLSVLCVSEDKRLVSTLHTSFPDYMLDEKRSGRYFCDPNIQHAYVAQRCLDTMRALLRFNICELESSYLLDDEVPDLPQRISRYIPPHLAYSCRHWGDHVCQARKGQELVLSCVEFLQIRVLYWTEVLNFLKDLPFGTGMLAQINEWLQLDSQHATNELLQDIQRFLTVVSLNVVSKSTPHIYVSVLALWNREEPMWTWYGLHSRELPWSEAIVASGTKSTALATWNVDAAQTEGRIYSIAFSPDGDRFFLCHESGIDIRDPHTGQLISRLSLASDSIMDTYMNATFLPNSQNLVTQSIQDVCVRNIETSALVAGPFSSPYTDCSLLALSPDCTRIAFGSPSNGNFPGQNIYVWELNIETGLVRLLTKRMDTGGLAEFSPESARIASHISGELCIWDANTGHVMLGPYAACSTLVFSGDDSRIATGDHKGMIRIIETIIGQTSVGPLSAHEEAVTALAFSCDSRQLASGSSDCTVRVWNSYTGDLVGGPFGQNETEVMCLAWFPNSHRIFVGTDQDTVCVWDGGARAACLVVPCEPVAFAAFTHDGGQYVFGQRNSGLYIHDGQTGDVLSGPCRHPSDPGQYSLSGSVSPEGKYIAILSSLGFVEFWDTRTSSSIDFPVPLQNKPIKCMVFSPCGKFFAARNDLNITIWSFPMGTQQARIDLGPYYNPQRSIGLELYEKENIAFSPCGTQLARAVMDDVLCIWDVHTVQRLVGPSRVEKSRDDTCVYYSHIGTSIALICENKLSVWDARSGNRIMEPLAACYNLVVFSPDDRYVLYWSTEDSLCVGNAHTGCVVTGPYRFNISYIYDMAYSPDGYLTYVTDGGRLSKWRLGAEDIVATPSVVRSWTIHKDGWVTGTNSERLLWVAPGRLGSQCQKVAVMHDRGPFGIDLHTAAVGTRWMECYRSDK